MRNQHLDEHEFYLLPLCSFIRPQFVGNLILRRFSFSPCNANTGDRNLEKYFMGSGYFTTLPPLTFYYTSVIFTVLNNDCYSFLMAFNMFI